MGKENKATMTLHFTSGTNTAANASAYQVTGGEWASGTIQWSNKPAANVLLQSNISHNNVTGYTINCLTAVQHWYTGDPTGQNENYGIMLRYYDETTADYNAVYSADHTVESKRPKLVITYTDPSVSILEGYTRTLSAEGATGTVTWTSSNTSVATVNSAGVVTGIKAGRATITASVGGAEYQSFTVYVKIQNGVYYIKNSESLCLGTLGQVSNGATTLLQSVVASGREQLNQLWRIDHLGSGYYIIRPLYNINMALHLSNGVVDLITVGNSDTLDSVPNTCKWVIEYGVNGYLFKCTGSGSLTMRCAIPYSNAMIITEPYSSTTTDFIWTLDRVTAITNQVLLLNTQTGESAAGVTKYIDPGEAVSLSELGIVASFVCTNNTDQSFTWSTQNPSVVSVDPETGAITPLQAGGTALITATHIYNGISYQKGYTVHVMIIPEGTYFIRSKSSGKYVDIKDTAMQNGTTIHQWDFSGNDSQKWTFFHIYDDVYSITSANSSNSYYLGVSGDSSDNDRPVVLRTGSVTDGMKWKIIKVAGGGYKLMPITGQHNNRVLSLDVGVLGIAIENGDTLQQRDYVDDENYKDEWYLQPMALELDTPLIYQTTNSWCWVASAEMLARTLWPNDANDGNYQTVRDEQRAAVYHVFGDNSATAKTYDWNSDPQGLKLLGGWYFHVANAAAYLSGVEDGDTVYCGYVSPYNQAELNNFLVDGYPVARLYARVTYDNSVTISLETLPDILENMSETLAGHVTVIKGVVWNEERGQFIYTVYDPGNYGGVYYMTYAELLFNVVATSETNRTLSIWHPTAVVKTDYSNETYLSGIFPEEYVSGQ